MNEKHNPVLSTRRGKRLLVAEIHANQRTLSAHERFTST